QMEDGAHARRTVGITLGVSLEFFYELCRRLDACLRVRYKHQWLAGHQADVSEVLDAVVVQVRVGQVVDGDLVIGTDQQRMAIRLRGRHALGADTATCSADV